MILAEEVLYLAGFIGTAREKTHSLLLHPFSALSTVVHSIFRHPSICYMATKLYMGLCSSSALGNCSCSNKLGKLIQLYFA